MLTNNRNKFTFSVPGTGLFGLAVSVWPIRSGRFGLAVSVWAVSVWAVLVGAVSVWPIRSGHFGHGTLRSDYEILQKSYINGKTSRLIQSVLPPSSYCRLPKVKEFNSKRTAFTIRNIGKRCRQDILLGIKFLVVVQSNWISGSRA